MSKLRGYLTRGSGGTAGLLRRIGYSQLSIFQGAYFLAGGLWPLIHMGSFVAVTGPKVDLWLVKTVGLLLAVIGAALLSAGVRWKVSLEILILAVGSAVVLAGVEIRYVLSGLISAVYLLDALIEIILIVLWISVRVRGGGESVCGNLLDPALQKTEEPTAD